MSFSDEYDDLDMDGIDPVWTSIVVRRSWQDEIRKLDPALRVLWDPMLREIAVVYRNPSMLTDFADGVLVGWALLIRFPADMQIDGIIANMQAMEDRNKYASAEAAVEASERKAEELEVKRKAALVERDGELFDEVERNLMTTRSMIRDDMRADERRRDSRHRAHARGRVLVPARLIGQPIKVGGSA